MNTLEAVAKVLKEVGDFIVGIFRAVCLLCDTMHKLTKDKPRRLLIVRRISVGEISSRKSGNLTAKRQVIRRGKLRGRRK